MLSKFVKIFPVAQMVKNLPAMQETWLQSLGQEDALKRGTAVYSSILAWRIPWIEEPDRLQYMGLQRLVHSWATNTHTHKVCHRFPSKEKASFNFVAAVTICSDFGAQENKVCHYFHFLPPSICHEMMGPDGMISMFCMLSFKPGFSLSSFTIKRLFSSSLFSAIRVMSSAYLRLLVFLLAILIPACASASLAFHKLYSVYKLNVRTS